MRAWGYAKFGGPKVVTLGDHAEPVLGGLQDVLVQVHAAALNPIDFKRRDGALKFVIVDHWPRGVGYDVAGVVTACGPGVSRFQVGDRVFGMLPHDHSGALAELVVVPESYLAKQPENLTHVEAASLPLVSLTALQCFRAGQLGEDKKVLITGGAGGVGTVAIQIAKSVFKAKTVATTASARKADKLKELGADEVIDYSSRQFENELSDYDFALDATGESKKCIECVARNGAVITIAETPSSDVFYGREAKGLHVSRLIGFVLDCSSRSLAKQARLAQVHYEFMFVIGDGKMLEEIAQLCEQGVLKPVIDQVYPFQKADSALAYLESGRATGKVVVELIAGSRLS